MTKMQFAYWFLGMVETCDGTISQKQFTLILQRISTLTDGTVTQLPITKFVDDLAGLLKYTKTYDLFVPFISTIFEQFLILVPILEKGNENIPVHRSIDDFITPRQVPIRPLNIPIDTSRITC